MTINKIKLFDNYINEHKKSLSSIDINELLRISNHLEKVIKNKNNIFVAGNGGSASIANHLQCDFNKNIKFENKNKLKPKVISLSNSIEQITAISNDIGYEKIFSFQIDNYYKKNDCLICFSCSGQSENIIEVIKFAKEKEIKTILIQGFGKINKMIKPNFYLNLKNKNYGISEDIFSSIMHMIAQSISFNKNLPK
jgi:phosphoheptose isomerase